ncbi:MAG: FKBP-type peptidyl-prolyl cis-trans isomerase [Bacteroidetes bacterium]|nr:FKBP-type peptidyl-prolyl cis-trans isomerase [Bacteroidota bacterium]NOG94931.1 FKBP-type peptidyl-prolyl cis-trans isomerase [Bacteroidota bacterium]NUM49474.1 FKBP-type peptidyl-prolyl cis-trans isomerase [Flavobacteriales bacterium]
MAELPPFIKPATNLTFELRLTDISTIEELQAKAQQEAEKMAVVENENIKNYITENKISTPPTQSGLYYIELQKGKGAKAEPGKSVKVHYTGTILDGTKFDSSVDRNEPFEFILGQGGVIRGWEEGIGYMQAGGKAKLIIPSFLAYGEQQRGPVIKPFSTLVFEVELLEVK